MKQRRRGYRTGEMVAKDVRKEHVVKNSMYRARHKALKALSDEETANCFSERIICGVDNGSVSSSTPPIVGVLGDDIDASIPVTSSNYRGAPKALQQRVRRRRWVAAPPASKVGENTVGNLEIAGRIFCAHSHTPCGKVESLACPQAIVAYPKAFTVSPSTMSGLHNVVYENNTILRTPLTNGFDTGLLTCREESRGSYLIFDNPSRRSPSPPRFEAPAENPISFCHTRYSALSNWNKFPW